MAAFVTCDGEPKQLEVLQEPDILEALRETNIVLGKTPASSSAICQSSDVSKYFVAAKTAVRNVDDVRNDDKNIKLDERLKMQFQLRGTMSGDKASKTINGLHRIVNALRDVTSMSTIARGYRRAGQYPVDLKKAMERCTYPLTESDFDVMQKMLPNMVEEFRSKGGVSEDTMDTFGIVSVKSTSTNSLPKDQRVLHQQRAVVVNAADTIARCKQYEERRLIRNSSKGVSKTKRRSSAEVSRDKAFLATLSPEDLKLEMKKRREQKRLAKPPIIDISNADVI